MGELPGRSVFLLAAAQDRHRLRGVAEDLAEAGCRVLDPGSAEPPASSARRGIETADRVVLVWSERAEQAGLLGHLLPDVIRSWSAGKLVVAKLDGAELPTGLADLDAVDLRGGAEDGSRELVEAVRGGPPGVFSGAPPLQPTVAPQAPSLAPRAARRGRRLALLGLALALLCGAGIAVGLLTLQRQAPLPTTSRPEAQRPTAPGSPPAPRRDAEVPTAPAPLPTPPRPSPLPSGRSWTGWETSAIVLLLGAGLGGVLVLFWGRRQRPTPSRVAPPAPSAQTRSHPEDHQAQIFVSYSRRNESAVDALVREIEQFGYRVWMDRRATGTGRYAAEIVAAIKASKLVALMCSRDSFESDHVTREVYVAGDFGKPFIAIQLDPTEIPDELLYFLSGFPRVPAAAARDGALRAHITRLVAP